MFKDEFLINNQFSNERNDNINSTAMDDVNMVESLSQFA